MAVVGFRGFDAVVHALARGVVPLDVAAAPVNYGSDDAGRVWVEPTGPLSRPVAVALQRLGARVQGQSDVALTQRAGRWAEVVPLRRVGEPPAERVVFVLPSATELAGWAAELQRLGRPLVAWQRLADGRTLVRADAPPQFTLERATAERGVALVEQAPRVWVEWGFRHPLPTPDLPARGRATLIRHDRPWESVEAEFETQRRRWPLPAEAHRNADPTPLSLSLRLTVGDRPSSAPELWVLGDDGWEQLRQWVSASDDELVARLLVARIESNGRHRVLVSARPGRDGPPVVVLDGKPYGPYLKLPNLFVAIGRGLQPPLRRDVARRSLATSTAHITWVEAGADGAVATSVAPASSFQPLPKLVRYRPPAVTTIEPIDPVPVFTVEPFKLRERPVARLRSAVPPPQTLGEHPPGVWRSFFSWVRGAWRLTPGPAEPTGKPVDRAVNDDTPRTAAPLIADPTVDTLEQRLREEIRGGAVGSLEGWRRLARAYHSTGRCGEAALGWQVVLWEHETPAGDDARAWWLAECAADADRAATSSVRAAAAAVVMSASPRADEVRSLIVTQESSLTVRAAWLAQRALAAASGDHVALARARDRLFERLLRDGLRLDQEVPAFLRRPGPGATSRGEAVRRWLPRGRELARRWLVGRAGGEETAAPRLERYGLARERTYTPAYADLLFAWGLARLGEREAAGALAGQAAERLPTDVPAHGWLVSAFQERIRDAVAGRDRPRPLSAELRDRLAGLDYEARVAVDRFRAASRVLEDTDLVNPYDSITSPDPLAGLADVADPAELDRRINELLRRVRPTAAARVPVIGAGVQVAIRGGPTLTQQLLGRLLREFDPPTNDTVQFEAAAHGLTAAAAVGLPDFAQRLAERLGTLLRRVPAPTPGLVRFLDAAVHALRRLGLRDELATLAARAENLQGDGPADRFVRLALAAAWLAIGNDDRAIAELDQARTQLFAPDAGDPSTRSLRLDLTLAYVGALAAAPARLVLGRLEELFSRLPVPTDSFSSNAFFALAPLRLVESIVRAVVDASTGLDPLTRRWLDEDELRVRTRIGRDLHAVLSARP